jgi:hypothetical protein
MLEEVALPRMLEFTGLVDSLEASHDQMRECIRRFDEDLCEKASNASVILMKEQLERSFIYRDDFDHLTKICDKINERMDSVNNNLDV